MNVFISWSGSKSRDAAVALRDWLPFVINRVEPFVSTKDIYAGTRWQLEIAERLEATNFGIVCVTQENQFEPWINFEAGALAKTVDSSRVVPLAIDLKPSDVKLPLGQFQAQPASKEGTRELVTSMNAASESPLSDLRIERALQKWWPDLASSLEKIEGESASSRQGEPSLRSDRELLEETLNTVRSLARIATLGVGESAETVPLDHPLIDQLEELLKAHDDDPQILHAIRGRQLAIRTSRTLPKDLKADVRKRAASYGITTSFVLKRPKRRRAEQSQEGAEEELEAGEE